MKGTVIITGAGKGIGLALARWFSKEQYRVIGISRSTDALLNLANTIPLKADLNHLDNLFSSLLPLIQEENSDLRYLIHNAGLLINAPFGEMTNDQIQEMTQVNYTAPLLLTQKLLPWLNHPAGSHIIYVGSMSGFQGSVRFPGLAVYSSGKSALASLAESLAYEYHATNMRFNALALGAVDTQMLQESLPGFVTNTTPEQIADYIGTFAIQAYPLINGKVIPVAGMNPEI